MRIVGLWRYPVKSLQGEALTEMSLEPTGVVGDRRWAIRDETTGRILTARRAPELLFAAATYDGDQPVITLPDGRRVAGPGTATDDALSKWLARPVTLVTAGLDRGRAEYFADATDDTSEAVEFTMPVGRYVDASPTLLLTTASLRAGALLHPAGAWEPRRFRPNLLVDAGGPEDGAPEDGWLEDNWVGRPVQVGGAALTPVQACVRCTMVTRPQPGLAHDTDIFRTLAQHHGGHLGVWSDVSTPGTVALGDPVSVGDPRLPTAGAPA